MTESYLEVLASRLASHKEKATELRKQYEEVKRQLQLYEALVQNYEIAYKAEQQLASGTMPDMTLLEYAGEKLPASSETSLKKVQHMTLRHAVRQVLSNNSRAMHASEICKVIEQSYPMVKVKGLKQQVVVQLIRDKEKGLYERVAPNTFRLIRKD